jgi:hypothetical protein
MPGRSTFSYFLIRFSKTPVFNEHGGADPLVLHHEIELAKMNQATNEWS